MTTQTNHYRIANASYGLAAHVEENRLGDRDVQALSVDTEDGRRIAEPMKRVNGTLTPVAWETAIAEIGEALRAVRSA